MQPGPAWEGGKAESRLLQTLGQLEEWQPQAPGRLKVAAQTQVPGGQPRRGRRADLAFSSLCRRVTASELREAEAQSCAWNNEEYLLKEN